MKKILNNKGFTLVELLAVLVILVAIMGIAIPTISSSLERTKSKQNDARKEIIESAAEQYVTDNKNAVYAKLEQLGVNSCYVRISKLSDYLSSDEMKGADSEDWRINFVVFTKPNDFQFRDSISALSPCVE